jgi:hypothetical protein
MVLVLAGCNSYDDDGAHESYIGTGKLTLAF